MSIVKKKKIVEEIIFFIISFFIMFSSLYSRDMNNVDEMWTFSFSSKLANGYMVYRDYNMVQTPLFLQITALFLKLFGNTMIVSCFVGSIIGASICLIQYITLRYLKVEKKATSIFMVFLVFYLSKVVTNSYNILALLFVYLILYTEICKVRYERYIKLTGKIKNINIFNKKLSYSFLYNIITGICIGLAFLSKQTVGVYLVIAITLYYFGQVFLLKEKKFKKAFIELTQKACSCIFIILVEMLWLYLNGALYQFIDYTVLGIGHFGAKNKANFVKNILLEQGSKKIVLNILFGVVLLIVPTILYLKKKGYIKVYNKLENKILLISITFFIIAIGYSFPLANEYHVDMTRLIILYLGIINLLAFKGVRDIFGRQMSNVSYCILIIIISITSLINIYWTYNLNKTNTIKPFQYMNLSESTQKEILEMTQYIENFEKENNAPIYIIDSEAAKYNLVLERNGGIFDLPLYGNLGKKDYTLMIEKLEAMNNYAVIIRQDEKDIFWQEPKEIRKYVLRNFSKLDSILKRDYGIEENKEKSEYVYDVYIKK